MGKPIMKDLLLDQILFYVISCNYGAFVFSKNDIIIPLLEIVPKAIEVCLSIFNPYLLMI